MEQDKKKIETLCEILDEINKHNSVEDIRKEIDSLDDYRDNILGTDKEDIEDLKSRAECLIDAVEYKILQDQVINDLKELFHMQ